MVRVEYKLILGRSKWILVYLVGLHLFILLTLLSLALPHIWDGTVIVSMIGSFIYYCRQQQWLRSKNSLSQLERYADNNWAVHYQNGKTVSALELNGCVECSFLIILTFRRELSWRSYSVIVMADAVETEAFRQLRLFCRSPKTFPE